MNWEQIEGQWHQLKGEVKSTWGKLTDDDMTVLSGKKDDLVGRIQQRYGILKDEAESQVDAWIGRVSPDPHRKPPSKNHPQS